LHLWLAADFEALKRGFAKTETERVKQLANHLLKHNNAQVLFELN